MLEEYDEIGRLDDAKGIEEPTKLSQLQSEYLKELDIPSDVWNEMPRECQAEHIGSIKNRFDEINIPTSIDRESAVKDLFSHEIAETYKQIEASHDFIQIEQVSDVLADCKELDHGKWQQLEMSEKEYVLNDLEHKIAEIEHRPPCPVRIVNLPHRTFGGYNPETKTIDINSIYVKMSDVDKRQFREVIDTLIHEGRHAYQDYNVNVCEVHPRHSEVISWAETMEGGKWGYHGDVSTKLGQRLYEQQSIEIDARNFAADVLDKFEQKQTV
ncbi:hypothetical protein [Marseilla massiliensis]|uniref:Uncharacterized protein n=1 Tax=Marseilla massiliensis TaxID=1841864 RepID=A0A938WT48_9BACT|nr:hypothetical protein [Marseilla massiliensis]MBM6673868.1 hypothetical protein [Marseilla massiliensis]